MIIFSRAFFGWVFKAILKSCLSPRRLLLFSKLMYLMCSVWRLLHDWLSEEKAPSLKSQWSELRRDWYTCCITRHIHVTIVTHEESELHLGEIISSNIKNPSYNIVVQKAMGQGCKVKIPCSLQNKNLLSSALLLPHFDICLMFIHNICVWMNSFKKMFKRSDQSTYFWDVFSI